MQDTSCDAFYNFLGDIGDFPSTLRIADNLEPAPSVDIFIAKIR